MSTNDKQTQESPLTTAQKSDAREGYGCFSLIVLILVLGAVYHVFDSVGSAGAIGAGIASFGLCGLGLGILYIGAKYFR
jgi:hypothetical protein